ncbi:peptide ABC transporter permease [Mixta theicola]|uniref:Peptide ABC transporter permease n=1 Tax=Mixta theicola TaxID=1458355 RepID=A0A2K1QEI4_9GAMM|nr:ShlB/FhaC/HecB family hemolysin secretion/activation protein [Mixta theicola]PNS13438.1 peptide ABC transporter permease [Mixta theicola]GLR09754.1 peptide ABC transporter permease [Mixta theicola]
MKKIVNFLWSIVFYHFSAVAQSDVNTLIKEQHNNDSTVRHENQVKKKDVYSTIESKKMGEIDFPDEKPCFRLDEISINNTPLEMSAATKIKEEAVGRCLGKQGISKLAQTLQDVFINAGYITTRIEIPPQDLSSAILRLNVIPGRIDDVILESDDVTKAILPFGKEDILNVRDIEQGLENLQRVPGVDVKINIEPGSRDSYSRIVIYTNRKTSWNMRASVNNWGDKSTGQYLASVSGYAYNLAHINDIFYLSGSQSISAGYSSISTYYSFPLGYWEYELFYSHSVSHQGINSDEQVLDYSGKNHYASIKTSRTLYRDRDKKVSAFIEALRRKSDYQLDEIKLALQKRDMSNIRLGINYKQNYAAAMLNGTLVYHRFTRLFGGQPSPDMVTGDVSSGSHLLSLDINYLKRLSYGSLQAYYDVNLGMQYAPETLVLQDQLALGSRWNVRGFENSAGLYGDKGFYLQNTVNIMTGLKGAEPYLGLDYGEVSMSHSSQQGDTKRLMGATIGLKGSVNSLRYNVSLSAPLAYPSELKTDRLTMNFNLTYQI